MRESTYIRVPSSPKHALRGLWRWQELFIVLLVHLLVLVPMAMLLARLLVVMRNYKVAIITVRFWHSRCKDTARALYYYYYY